MGWLHQALEARVLGIILIVIKSQQRVLSKGVTEFMFKNLCMMVPQKTKNRTTM